MLEVIGDYNYVIIVSAIYLIVLGIFNLKRKNETD